MDEDPIEIDHELEIRDATGGTRALVAPNRGGMVTALVVDGRSLLYLDRETLRDPARSVRGGIPVLFPTPGKLAGDRWSCDGHAGGLPQHGFARTHPWTIVERRRDAIRLRLDAPPDTRAAYPWEHALELTYRVHARELRIETRVQSRAGAPMPFGLGFHPYFVVGDKRSFTLETDATRAFDNATKQVGPFDPRALRLDAEELDLHLVDQGASTVAFTSDGLPRVVLEASPELSWWVLWTLPGRDFVCVEPWSCPGDALNTGERLLRLAPGGARELSFSIRVEPG